jgi:hypothetical protein
MSTKYKATFSNGLTINRKSEDRNYTHAWIVTGRNIKWDREHNEILGLSDEVVVKAKGFAGSAELARKAAEAAASRWNMGFSVWQGMSSSARAIARAKNAKIAAARPLTPEVVAVEVV